MDSTAAAAATHGQKRAQEWEWCDDDRAPSHARKPRHACDQGQVLPMAGGGGGAAASPPSALGRALSREIARLGRAADDPPRDVEFVDYSFEPHAVRDRYMPPAEDVAEDAGEEPPDLVASPTSAAACPAPRKAMRFAYT